MCRSACARKSVVLTRSVSRKPLPTCLNEFEFQWNSSYDGARLAKAIKRRSEQEPTDRNADG